MNIHDVLSNRRSWHIECAHVLDGLRMLPDNSVHCAVTSPPYYGLRAYGTDPRIWGGDPECPHDWNTGHAPGWRKNDEYRGKQAQPGAERERNKLMSDTCVLCGAWRGELGLEPTMQMFIAHMVSVFREVRRVLRPDGVLWLNMGDCYSGSWGNYAPGGIKGAQRPQTEDGKRWDRKAWDDNKRLPPTAKLPGFKPKDLCLVPHRLAIALQEDGWWVRSTVVWDKPNVLPESAKDRPTTAHEYIFMLTKSARYFYDALAIAEPAGENTHSRGKGTHRKLDEATDEDLQLVRNKRSWAEKCTEVATTRNKRTVWRVEEELYRLRTDLTPEQRAYALQRLSSEEGHSPNDSD